MMPWIRGWGADVEVLEPEGLREVMIQESAGICEIYHG
ncbi:MAG: WCX domain-containing protein [Bellilinea sp.]